MKAPVAREQRCQGLATPILQAEEIAAGYLEVNEQTEDSTRARARSRKPAWKGR
jgi:hypothetical protein